MEEYLSKCRQVLTSGEIQDVDEVHIVLGNTSGDLDSTICALTYGYYLSQAKYTIPVLPVLNFHEDNYRLNVDITKVLADVGITQELLTFRNQIDLQGLFETKTLTITIVDHNTLSNEDSTLEGAVVEVIDHHQHDRPHTDKCVVTIEPVGSCCTLVAEKLLADDSFTVDKTIASLLHATILLDTVCLSTSAGRTTDKDKEIVDKLEAILTVSPTQRQEIFNEVQYYRFDTSGLTMQDILRKEVKTVPSHSGLDVAVITVAVDNEDFFKTPELEKELSTFCSTKSVGAVVAMVSVLIDRKKDDMRRQLAVYSDDRELQIKVADYLESCRDPDLELTRIEMEKCQVLAYNQGLVSASRKKVLPLVMTALSKPDMSNSESVEAKRQDESDQDSLLDLTNSFDVSVTTNTTTLPSSPLVNQPNNGTDSDAMDSLLDLTSDSSRQPNSTNESNQSLSDLFDPFSSSHNAGQKVPDSSQHLTLDPFDPLFSQSQTYPEDDTFDVMDNFVDFGLGEDHTNEKVNSEIDIDNVKMDNSNIAGEDNSEFARTIEDSLEEEPTSSLRTVPLTPQNSFAENTIGTYPDRELPSFNNSVMVRKIQEKKDLLEADLDFNEESDDISKGFHGDHEVISPNMFTPQNSYSDNSIESPSKHDLPSFNNSEMIKKIEEKKKLLAEGNNSDIHEAVSPQIFTPQNSFQDNTLQNVAEHRFDLDDEEKLKHIILEKRSSLEALSATDVLESMKNSEIPTETTGNVIAYQLARKMSNNDLSHSKSECLIENNEIPTETTGNVIAYQLARKMSNNDLSHSKTDCLIANAEIPSETTGNVIAYQLAKTIQDNQQYTLVEEKQKPSNLDLEFFENISVKMNEMVSPSPNLDSSQDVPSHYSDDDGDSNGDDNDHIKSSSNMDNVDEDVIDDSLMESAHNYAEQIIQTALDSFQPDEVENEHVGNLQEDMSLPISGQEDIKVPTADEVQVETEYLPSIDPLHGSMDITKSVHLFETDASKAVAEEDSFNLVGTDETTTETDDKEIIEYSEELAHEVTREAMSVVESVQEIQTSQQTHHTLPSDSPIASSEMDIELPILESDDKELKGVIGGLLSNPESATTSDCVPPETEGNSCDINKTLTESVETSDTNYLDKESSPVDMDNMSPDSDVVSLPRERLDPEGSSTEHDLDNATMSRSDKAASQHVDVDDAEISEEITPSSSSLIESMPPTEMPLISKDTKEHSSVTSEPVITVYNWKEDAKVPEIPTHASIGDDSKDEETTHHDTAQSTLESSASTEVNGSILEDQFISDGLPPSGQHKVLPHEHKEVYYTTTGRISINMSIEDSDAEKSRIEESKLSDDGGHSREKSRRTTDDLLTETKTLRKTIEEGGDMSHLPEDSLLRKEMERAKKALERADRVISEANKNVEDVLEIHNVDITELDQLEQIADDESEDESLTPQRSRSSTKEQEFNDPAERKGAAVRPVTLTSTPDITKKKIHVDLDAVGDSTISLSSRSASENDLLADFDGTVTPDDKTPTISDNGTLDLQFDDEVDPVEPIPEYSAEEELENEHNWRTVTISNKKYKIDMKVIEPYKRVLSHGGYYGDGLNAIVLFSACYLPNKSRRDYQYVMDNLFLYLVSTLELLVAEDYVIVYFHGATPRSRMPRLGWLKRCYQMIDRRLRKNLKGLFLVHPTVWLKTVLFMTRPFISSKFTSKIKYMPRISDLANHLPMDYIYIPDEIKQYDAALSRSKTGRAAHRQN